MQHNERIVQLLYRRLKSLPLTVEENQELDAWMARSESNRKIFDNLSDEAWVKEARKRYYAPGKESGLAQLREQLFEEAPVKRSRGFSRLAVAATVLIIFTAIYFLIPTKQSSGDSQMAQTEVKNHQLFITPGGEAILTLSNGTKTPLREQANGLLAQLGNGTQLLKQDGKLVYQYAVAQSTAGGVDYSADPRSDQYSVVLPDGSRVWLNRGSVLTYPEKFSDNARSVELTGEAYFEIAKVYAANGTDRIPFRVKIPAQSNSGGPGEVEVLGTHFNIYAHQGEPVKTTLTEGKIKMHRGNQAEVLSPGQQAVMDTGNQHIAIKDNVDITAVLAWKDYKFQFREESIQNIMMEIKRWYNVPSVIQIEFTRPFTLICDRNKPLSAVLELLNENGRAKFTMDAGNNIVVTP
jgi:transmembrane sensor